MVVIPHTLSVITYQFRSQSIFSDDFTVSNAVFAKSVNTLLFIMSSEEERFIAKVRDNPQVLTNKMGSAEQERRIWATIGGEFGLDVKFIVC